MDLPSYLLGKNASGGGGTGGIKIIILTETEYNALTTYADNTEYHIIEG